VSHRLLPLRRLLARPLLRRLLPLIALTAALALGAGSSAAQAAVPWWRLGIEQRPAGVSSGSARSEVQELVVSAGSGTFVLTRTETAGKSTAELPFNVSAPALQSALEGLYGAGTIQVSGGVGDEAGDKPYVLSFGGALADQPVEPLFTGSSKLKGGHSDVTSARRTEGRPDGQIVVLAENLGDALMEGATAPVTLSAVLPAGLHAVGISASAPEAEGGTERTPLACSLASLSCTYEGKIAPYDALELRIDVLNTGASPGEAATASVTGGGGASAVASHPVALASGPPAFGAEAFEIDPEEEGGALAALGGEHPFQLTTTVTVNQGADRAAMASRGKPQVEPAVLTKDLHVKLPPGLLGNPTAAPVCSMAQFLTFVERNRLGGDECSAGTAVGVASVTVDEPLTIKGALTLATPVFNLPPAAGEPARLGFYIALAKVPVLLDTALERRPDGSYAVTVSTIDAPQAAGLLNTTVTIWGNPADPSHDNSRGWGCLQTTRGGNGLPCSPGESAGAKPFLTLPTSCTGSPQALLELDSWADPGAFSLLAPQPALTATAGCGALRYEPSVQVTPGSAEAASPSGLSFALSSHDEGLVSAGGRAESQVKKVVVTLPEEMTANPSFAAGLGACSEAEYESETIGSAPGTGCPPSSKIGEVEVETPLLSDKLLGSVYLAKQSENPFHTLLALYIVVKDPKTGVLVRLAGKVEPDELTGQLTATFDNNPQVPFSRFELRFPQGPRSSLVAPALCGTHSTRIQLTPWASPDSVTERSSGFAVTGACSPSPAQEPNSPSFEAGTANPAAGAFSPLLVRLKRADGSQDFSSVAVTLPPGATGKLAGIPQCSDAQIAGAQARNQPGQGAVESANPSCPAASQIGTVTVGAGAGSSPLYVSGNAYLAGPYKGAPFSGVFITPAIAGPFDLGVVVVRAGLYIDPATAQVTTRSDALPTILQGIPLDIRSITVDVDRAEFTLNPTNCTPMAANGEEISTEGQAAPLTARFQVGNCASLPFQPKLIAKVAGKASKANGTTFTVNVTSAGLGQASIAKVALTLPKALPTRLTTIQKACPDATFNANPAACPEGSVIGTAKIHTPLLQNPLSGPAYLVSHGNAAFPDVEFVLQGEGVTLVLDGKTDIKKGITYSRFESVPDAPFTSFETVLPAGPHSALTANVPQAERFSLCKQKLAMPTEITGQNGAVIRQTTNVALTGCPKVKALTRAQKLAVALRACKKKGPRKRAACQQLARKRYGPVKAKQRHKAKH
jgi:hypothetical protein